jgi:EF hand
MRSLQFAMGALLAMAVGATVVEAQQGRRMRFRGMDTNGDGVITRAEWRGSARSFDVHDINQDGVLSGTEVRINDQRDVYRDRDGWNDLVDQFDSVDRNNNGVISRDEWYGDRTTFNRLDRDRNGVLRLSEFLGAADPDDTMYEDDRYIDDEQIVGTGGRREMVGTQAYRSGFDRGLLDGRQAGQEDRQNNRAWDLEGQRELEQADAGYQNSMGRRDHYQAGYRAGFRQGYRQGFGPR